MKPMELSWKLWPEGSPVGCHPCLWPLSTSAHVLSSHLTQERTGNRNHRGRGGRGRKRKSPEMAHQPLLCATSRSLFNSNGNLSDRWDATQISITEADGKSPRERTCQTDTQLLTCPHLLSPSTQAMSQKTPLPWLLVRVAAYHCKSYGRNSFPPVFLIYLAYGLMQRVVVSFFKKKNRNFVLV